MQREDGSFMILLLLSFPDRDSSGKPYLVQAYPAPFLRGKLFMGKGAGKVQYTGYKPE